MTVTADDIAAAAARIMPHLTPTPLEPAAGQDRVWLKLENANLTHSFKIRGALNAMLRLQERGAARDGVIAASSGNHAQALACAVRLTGVRATILMPRHTPRKKVDGVRRQGGEAVLFGDNYDQAEAEAIRRAREAGGVYVSPYNDPDVVAGAGTVGREIAAQLPEVGRVLVCTSGGGLLSGVAIAIKAHNPQAEVIAVCAEHAPAMYNVLTGEQRPQVWETLAEALSGEIEDGSITIPLVRQHVDRAVLVSEAMIAETMRWFIGTQGWLVEGGGAVATAAVLHGVVPADDVPTVCVVSGGNVDVETVRQVLYKGKMQA